MTDEEKRAKSSERVRAWRRKKRVDAEFIEQERARSRARYAKNSQNPDYRARKNALDKARRDANPAQQSAYRKKWRAAHPGYRSPSSATFYVRMSDSKKLHHGARCRAKERGLEFAITPDDITVPDNCPVLGVPLRRGKGCLQSNSPSLDRIDPTKGYAPGNIQVISHRANTLKNNATLEEIEALYLHMKSLRDRGVRFGESGNQT